MKYQIKKLFISGYLQGVIVTEKSPVYVPEGMIIDNIGNRSGYIVLSCKVA